MKVCVCIGVLIDGEMSVNCEEILGVGIGIYTKTPADYLTYVCMCVMSWAKRNTY